MGTWAKSRKLVLAVVAGYLAALGLATLPHRHTSEGWGVVELTCGGVCSNSCSSISYPPDESTIPGPPYKNPSHDCYDYCFLCQFLAQQPAPVGDTIPLTAIVPPLEIAEAEIPAAWPNIVLPTWYSRGPPAQF